MSFLPALKYLSAVAIAGFVYVIMNQVLLNFLDMGENTSVKTLLFGIWAIGIPILILLVAGIRAIMLYMKNRYEVLR